jgi:hypothetical protein
VAYEPEVFAAWSQALLTGDATLMALLPGGVWDQAAPPKTPYPFVVRTLAGGGGRAYALGVQPILYDGLWYFTVYVATRLAAILDRLDSLLQRASGTAGGGTVLLCVQEGGALASPPDATGGALVSAVAVPYSAQVQIP